MGAAELRGDPALRRPVEEAEPEQERLVDVLDRLDLLRRGRRRAPATPTGPEANFWMIAARSLRSVESRPSSSISISAHRRGAASLVDPCRRRGPGRGRGRACRSRLTMRGVPRPRVAIGPRRPRRRSRRRGCRPSARRSRSARRPRRSRAGRSRRSGRGAGELIRPARVVAPTTVNGLRLRRRLRALRALADHHVERVVLHRRVEDLLDRPVQAVDLVDEQDVALVEGGEDRGEVPGPLDRRAR